MGSWSSDRSHGGRPPTSVYYVQHARAGLEQTSQGSQLERVWLPAGRRLDLQEQGIDPRPCRVLT